MSSPEEQTPTPRDAAAALAESRRSKAVTAAVVADARATFRMVRAHREANHYADKFRAIIRGNAP